MGARYRHPSGPIEKFVTGNSVIFAGKIINISAIARTQNLDRPNLSNVLNGRRGAGINTIAKIAAALDMTMEEVIQAIEDKKELLRKHPDMIRGQYLKRAIEEDSSDLKVLQKGGVPKPRLPGTRSQL